MSLRSNKSRFLPRIDVLEDRMVLATSITAGATTTITGDGGVNKVKIVDNGDGDLKITDLVSGSVTTVNNVTKIKFDLKGGGDRISYTQTGNRTRSMTIDGKMGSGSDLFSGFIQGDILANRTLDIKVLGDSGADGIDLTANTDVDVQAGATMKLRLSGGDDKDRVDFNYQGELDGTMRYHLSGDGGDDNGAGFIRATIRADLGSSGQVGLVGETALVEGNSGDDSLGHFVFKDPSDIFLAVSAKVDGGNGFLFFSGNDVANHTANVTSVNVESDFIT